jgi:hypothetical protein
MRGKHSRDEEENEAVFEYHLSQLAFTLALDPEFVRI